MRILQNLISRVKLMFAPDNGAGGGSAEGGTPAPANAEDQLAGAFSSAAGADGAKPDAKPNKGDKAAGGTDTGSGDAKLAAWTEQLPPEIRGNPDTAAKLAKYQKVGDMAKAFLDLQAQVDGEKAGRPKTADEYSFAKNKENEGAAFADAAFKANLTAAQADAMFKSLNEFGAARLAAAQNAQTVQVKETAAALAAEYGSKYEQKMELLTRGLIAAGPNVGRLLSQAGLAGNPEIVKAFISFGEMTAESGAARGGGAGEPIKSVMEGGSFEFKI